MSDERWTANRVAEHLGITARTFRTYSYRGQAPAPDGREELSGKPWWWESTILAWEQARPGRGAPGRSRLFARV